MKFIICPIYYSPNGDVRLRVDGGRSPHIEYESFKTTFFKKGINDTIYRQLAILSLKSIERNLALFKDSYTNPNNDGIIEQFRTISDDCERCYIFIAIRINSFPDSDKYRFLSIENTEALKDVLGEFSDEEDKDILSYWLHKNDIVFIRHTREYCIEIGAAPATFYDIEKGGCSFSVQVYDLMSWTRNSSPVCLTLSACSADNFRKAVESALEADCFDREHFKVRSRDISVIMIFVKRPKSMKKAGTKKCIFNYILASTESHAQLKSPSPESQDLRICLLPRDGQIMRILNEHDFCEDGATFRASPEKLEQADAILTKANASYDAELVNFIVKEKDGKPHVRLAVARNEDGCEFLDLRKHADFRDFIEAKYSLTEEGGGFCMAPIVYESPFRYSPGYCVVLGCDRAYDNFYRSDSVGYIEDYELELIKLAARILESFLGV